jgi:hypothetical protein
VLLAVVLLVGRRVRLGVMAAPVAVADLMLDRIGRR